MKSKIAVVLTVLLFAFLSVLNAQTMFYNESFETNSGWTLGENWDIANGALYFEFEPVLENFSLTALSPLISVPNNATDLVVKSYIQNYPGLGTPPEAFEIAVLFGPTEIVLWTFNSDSNFGVSTGTDIVMSIAACSGQDIRIRFRCSGESTENIDYWMIFEIKAFCLFSHDLSAGNFTALDVHLVGQPSACSFEVINHGYSNVIAGSYAVSLMQEGDIELVTLLGSGILSGQSVSFTFNWTPLQTGSVSLSAKIIYTEDAFPANNTSRQITVLVQPQESFVIDVGLGDYTERIPIDFFFRNSLYQCLYLDGEVYLGGLITGIAFYNNFTQDLAAKPTKIWLGTTSQNNLANGWIPASQMTLVFDGVMNYPVGDNIVVIPFQNPFGYTDGNLVLMVQRPMDANFYFMGNNFFCQNGGFARGRWASSDFTVFNPDNPSGGQLTNLFPKATFIITNQGLGALSGTVTSNQVPLSGAVVSIGNILNAITSDTGTYSFTYVPLGQYQVTCSKFGYVTQIADVTINQGLTAAQNFDLQQSSYFIDSYEDYPDFSTNFSPWLSLDIDQLPTYNFPDHSFTGEGQPSGFMVFNPYQTVPPLTESIIPYTGNKLAAALGAVGGNNNDWLISPLFSPLTATSEISFKARALYNEAGEERFRVGLSTGSTEPNAFQIISSDAYIAAPFTWTEYVFQVPANLLNQSIRVGINCISQNGRIFMLDDFRLNYGYTDATEPLLPPSANVLQGNFPNPFNPETTIAYSVREAAPVVLKIYNLKGQKVRTLVDEVKAAGSHQVRWNGTDDNNIQVSSGVYFYKLAAGNFTAAKRMMLLK